MIETGYECKECGSPAVMQDGVIVRSCGHTGTVVMQMEAHVTASGTVRHVQQESSPNVG